MKQKMYESRGLIHQTRNNKNGIALILVLGILAVLVVLATTFAFNMRLEQKAARNYLDAITTDCIARAGVEYAIALLRNDRDSGNAYDCYDDSWSTSFRDKDTPTNNEVDNDGDGNPDSVWIPIKDAMNNLIGAYAIYVVDECGKMDINYSGNIVSATSEHASNDGVSTFEIDLLALDSIGLSNSDAADIAKYRYGGNEPGASGDDNGYATGIYTDLIDNDGDGTIDEYTSATDNEGTDEPQEFTAWYERGDDGPFKTPDEIKLVSSTVKGVWGNIKDNITVWSSTRNRYKRTSWSDKLNINAVTEVDTLYSILENAAVNSGTAEELACNIIDYRDKNNKISSYSSGGTTYYGIEPILINEILARSYYNTNPDYPDLTIPVDGGNNFETYTLAKETCYRIRITRTGNNKDLDVSIGGATDTIPGGTTTAIVGQIPLEGINLSNCITNVNGDIRIDISDPNPGDPPPSIPNGIDYVEFVSCEFIELINIGEEDIELAHWNGASWDYQWRINIGGTDFTIGSCEYHDGVAEKVDRSPIILGKLTAPAGDYLIIASDEELFARTFGSTDANWGDDPGETAPVVFMDSGKPGNGIWGSLAPGGGGAWDENEIDALAEKIELHDYTISPSGIADIVANIPGTTAEDYGDSGMAGKSVEKDDPTLRTNGNWDPHSTKATPGVVNENKDVTKSINNLYIKNSEFANVGEILNGTTTPSGTYEGIRVGSWSVITQADFEKIADKITTSGIKLEAEAITPVGAWSGPISRPYNTNSYYTDTDGHVSTFTWSDARIQPGDYKLYIYGYNIGSGNAIDVSLYDYENTVWVASGSFEYKETDGVSITTTISKDNIKPDGEFQVRLERTVGAPGRVYFDYLVLVPEVVHGRININTASSEVLDGLPGIDSTKAGNIITGRSTSAYGDDSDGGDGVFGIAELFSIPIPLSASEFAKISNLITTNSDAFKIYCTARAVQDMGTIGTYEPPEESGGQDITLAEKKVEVIVDRSSSPIKILSWKEITE